MFRDCGWRSGHRPHRDAKIVPFMAGLIVVMVRSSVNIGLLFACCRSTVWQLKRWAGTPMACRHDERIFVASSVGTMGILKPIHTLVNQSRMAARPLGSEGQARCEVE